MKYLHDRHCLHRDLAARNVLLCDGNIVKITDFGLAKSVYKYGDEYKKKSQTKVPIKWLAPESIHDGVYNKTTDIWSFGVLLWEIFTLGKVPYPGLNDADEILKMLDNEYRLPQPELADDETAQVMYACWHANPSQRCDFAQLVELFKKKLPANIVHYYETIDADPVKRAISVANRAKQQQQQQQKSNNRL